MLCVRSILAVVAVVVTASGCHRAVSAVYQLVALSHVAKIQLRGKSLSR
jgi:hypothetical protein